MTRGSVFNPNYRRSTESSARDESRAQWLVQALPDFGLVQLTGSGSDAIQLAFERKVEGTVVYWHSSSQYASFAELLVDELNISTTDHAVLQHSLRKWSERGEVLWVIADGEKLPVDLLMQIQRYAPVSKAGQFSVRVLLKISDTTLHSVSYKPLLSVVHERVGSLVSISGSHSDQSALSRYKIPALCFAGSIMMTGMLSLAMLEKFSPTPTPFDVTEAKAKAIEQTVKSESFEQGSTVDAFEIVSVNETTQLNEVINEWSTAWQVQNIDKYFSMYAQGYSAYKSMLPGEWRRWRKKRLKQPTWISIEVGPVQLERVNEVEIHARFWQLYRSDGYQDNTFKILSFRKEGGAWKIIGETNQEVRLLSKE